MPLQRYSMIAIFVSIRMLVVFLSSSEMYNNFAAGKSEFETNINYNNILENYNLYHMKSFNL